MKKRKTAAAKKKVKQVRKPSTSTAGPLWRIHAVGNRFEVRHRIKRETFGPYSSRAGAEEHAKILNNLPPKSSSKSKSSVLE